MLERNILSNLIIDISPVPWIRKLFLGWMPKRIVTINQGDSIITARVIHSKGRIRLYDYTVTYTFNLGTPKDSAKGNA